MPIKVKFEQLIYAKYHKFVTSCFCVKTFKWCTYLSQRIFSTQKTRYSLLIWKQPIRFEKQMPFSQICCQIIEGLFLDNHKEINFSSRSIFRFNSNSNSIQFAMPRRFHRKALFIVSSKPISPTRSKKNASHKRTLQVDSWIGDVFR